MMSDNDKKNGSVDWQYKTVGAAQTSVSTKSSGDCEMPIEGVDAMNMVSTAFSASEP
jgi:hypothetical protein